MKTAGKYVFFSTGLILVALHLSLWIQDNHAFSVKNAIVEGASLLTEEEILKIVQTQANAYIFEADLSNIERQLERLPQVKHVRVSRVFPSSIRIEIKEREPVAILVDNGVWGVDSEGVLIPRMPARHGMDYPVIVGFRLKQHLVGRPIRHKKVRFLASFLSQLRKDNPAVYHMISEITMNELLGVYMRMVSYNLPVVLGKKDLLKKCQKLELAMTYLMSANTLDTVRYVDLRFEDRIILKRRT